MNIVVAGTLQAADGSATQQDAEAGLLVAHYLRAEGFDASEDGTGRGTPLVPVPFDTTQITSKANYSNPRPGDPCHPLAAGAYAPAVAYTTKMHNTKSNNAGKLFEERSPCLDANSPAPALLKPSQVRRLTPRECERLQGFPDGYTDILSRGKPAADGPRYKALGNSMAVNVMRWIGERIAAIEAMEIGRKAA